MEGWSYILVHSLFNQVFAVSDHRIDDFMICAVFFVRVKKIWRVIHVCRSAQTFCIKRKHWIQICLNSNYLSGQRNHSLSSICGALLFKFQLTSARWCRPRRNVWSLWQRTTWRGVNRSWSSCGETITARGLTLFFLQLHKHHKTETTWWKSWHLQEMSLLQQV